MFSKAENKSILHIAFAVVSLLQCLRKYVIQSITIEATTGSKYLGCDVISVLEFNF